MNKLIRFHVYAAMAAVLALSPIAAPAQTSPTGNARETTTLSDARDDRHTDWGWLGLGGLLGLLRLMRRDRRDRYDTTSSATRRS